MVPGGNNRENMKNTVIRLLPLLAAAFFCTCPIASAQTVEYVDDEECGCSLVFVDGIQTTTDGHLFGFKRADGTVIVENRYLYVDQFHGDYCRVYINDTICGIINRDGREVVPCLYEMVEYPSCGRALVYRNGLFGYCNLNGDEVVPLKYRQAGSYSENLAPVLIDIDSFSFACTYIDTFGRQAMPAVFENLMPFSDGYAVARRYQRWGVIDTKGKEMLPMMYEFISVNQDGHFFAGDSAGMALFDYHFKPLSRFAYSEPGFLSDNRISVKHNGKYGFLDPQGREVVPCEYDNVGYFNLGRAMVQKDGKFGIIDTMGRIILPIEYQDSTPHGFKYVYYDSLALVEKDGKLGYVDLDGKLAIPFYFEQAYHFTQGLAAVRYNGLWGYINTKGEIYMPFVFTYASPFEWGRAEVVFNATVSNVDLRGKCVKNCNGVIAWR